MKNILVIPLILISLGHPGEFLSAADVKRSPFSEENEQVLLKEGHRVIVVEYENHGDTRVLISPQDSPFPKKADDGEDPFQNPMGTVESVKGKLREASDAIGDPGGLIGDAVGKCKVKVSEVSGQGKDAAHQVFDKMHEAEEGARDVVKNGLLKGTRVVGESIEKTVENIKETVKKSLGGMAETKTAINNGTNRASEKALQMLGKMHEIEDHAKDTTTDAIFKKASATKKYAKETVENMKETAGKTVGDAAEISRMIGKTRDKASEKAHQVFEKMQEIEKEAKETVNEMTESTGRRVVEMVDAAMGVVQVLGFCSAYGMGVWVSLVWNYAVAQKVLLRKQVVAVQSRIYRVYFRVMSWCVEAALAAHFLSTQRGWGMTFQCYCLAISLSMILTNLIYFDPRAAKVMSKMKKLEKEKDVTSETGKSESVKSEIMRLNEMLKNMNTSSSFLNFFSLLALTCQLLYLARRLQFST